MNSTRYFLAAVLTLISYTKAPAEEIKIGVIAPLTGVSANLGEEMIRTIRTFDVIQKRKTANNRYTFLIEDGKSGLGNAATTAAHKFISIEGIRFLIAGTSGETIQAGAVAERAKVILIGTIATVPEIRHLGDYIFRTYIDIERGIDHLVMLMHKKGKRFAIISEEAPFTLGIKNLFVNNAGSTIIFNEDFSADDSDFKSIITRLKSKKPDSIYLNAASINTLIPLVRQIREQGLALPLYSYFMPSDPRFTSTLGALAEGVIFLDTPVIQNQSVGFTAFLAQYTKLYPSGPQLEFLTRTTYDAVMALILAIETVGYESSHVKEELYRLKFNGALGEVSFNKDGDIINLDFSIKIIQNGDSTVCDG